MIALHHQLDGPDARSGAPVLVFGPSLGTDLHLFDAQVRGTPALGGDYRIVRFDLPGHGGSPTALGPYTMSGLADDVLALLDGLGVDRFHYAGVSIGGAIGQELAAEHPGRVASLTVIASAARFADPESWPARAATVRAHGTAAMLDSRPGTWFTHAFAERHPDEARRLLDMLAVTSDEGYAGCCEAIAGFDARDRLAGITAPTLAIAGAEDPATPPELVRLIADGVPDAKFLVVGDAAHLLSAERPALVNEALAEHLTTAQRT